MAMTYMGLGRARLAAVIFQRTGHIPTAPYGIPVVRWLAQIKHILTNQYHDTELSLMQLREIYQSI